MKKQKTWSSAPLPFQGQKRKFASEFRNILQCYPQCSTIVDLFGGSGLLSRIAKDERPDSRVIYNDYDRFSDRLANIPTTNKLLAGIRDIVKDLPRHQLIPKIQRQKILDLIAAEQGYVDFITISSSILFSSMYVVDYSELSKESFYNNVRIADYDLADDYMRDIEIVHDDYRNVFAKFSPSPSVLYLVDPPYLNTNVSSYSKDSFWTLKDYLDVLQVLKGTNYIYFTSDKSAIIELCEWLGDGRVTANPFVNAKRIDINERCNYASGYLDIMLFNAA